MSDYTWPSAVIPSSAALSWLDNTVVFRSPLAGTVRTESRPGSRWSLSLTVQSLKSGINLGLLEAFLFRLDGAQHRAVIPDFGYQRVGPGGGSPVVSGAGQTGLSLTTSGWPNSTLVLYAGDRIGVSGQMIPVTANVTSSGTGTATLSLAHPIRTAPSSGASIEITAPTARYILTNRASFATAAGIFKTVLAEFEEVIP